MKLQIFQKEFSTKLKERDTLLSDIRKLKERSDTTEYQRKQNEFKYLKFII